MNIVITKSKDGTIKRIDSYEYYYDRGKDDAFILESIKNSNKEYGYECFSTMAIDETYDELFSFLLGTDKYKYNKDINTISDKLDNITSYISSISRDIYDAENDLNASKNMINALTKKIGLADQLPLN